MTDTLLDLPAAEPPQEPATGLTAGHMEQMLRRHYLPEGRQPGGIFAPEIGSPCGKRRADLIWMPTTIAGGKGVLVGHEVKVSRADLAAELTDPAKADPWAQHCTYWWLVVASPDLISGLTIPDAWGVMSPPSGRRTRTMTIIKDAPRLTPRDTATGFARIAAWQMYTTHDRLAETQRDLAFYKKQTEKLRADVAEARAAGGSTWDDKRTRRVTALVAAIDRRMTETGGRWWKSSDIGDADIVEAIVDHAAVTESATAIRRRLSMVVAEVERIAAEPLGYALQEFRKAEKLAAATKQGKAAS